jgi:hypothetical protein
MFRPVGYQPPAVYWRRRLTLLAVLVLLVVLTAWVLWPGGGDSTAAKAPPKPSSGAQQSIGSSPARSTASKTAAKKAPTTRHHVARAAACTLAHLQLDALVGKTAYHVGDQPVVMLQVKNVGTKPCVQNLADSQVVLQIYNGESRVWGSHDCEIEPGTDLRTLAAGHEVRISITWSGLSSQPKCAGTRQRVGAGTYTVYALLAGHQGKAAQFAIS